MTLLLTTTAKDIAIDECDWPRCDKCEMPVENFCVTDTGDALTLVARCHNEVRTERIENSMWDHHLGWGIGNMTLRF